MRGAGVLVGGSFVIGVLLGTFVVAPMLHRDAPARPAAQQRQEDPFAKLVAEGNQAMDAKQYERAVAAYDRALAIRFDSDVATDRGVCFRLLGDRERALSTFDFILLKDPAHWQARYNRAVVLLEMGRIDDARRDAEAVARQQPNDPGIRQLRNAVANAPPSKQ